MRKALEVTTLIALICALLYVGQGELRYLYREAVTYVAPCRVPITYRVGTFDPRFGIREDDFISAITEAEALWEGAAGRQLFTHEDTGMLTVNLIYDYRQEATDKLAELGLVVTNDRASYDALKAKYDSLEHAYLAQKSAYDARVAAYTKQQNTYNASVESWNKRGGAPRAVYTELEAQKATLAKMLVEIRADEAALKKSVDTINALVEELNRLATTLNITASEFNQVGTTRGEEFTEGLYVRSSDEEKIDIYQFDSHAKLVRVLAHELGHALSLEHVDDPKAIMYRLNQGENKTLTQADVDELNRYCGFEEPHK